MKQLQFEPVFAALRKCLQDHSGGLTVTADRADHYCLSIEFSAKLNKGFPVAWVTIGKGYVSYHLMPVYMFPELRKSMTKKLKARMQGKSCFNFKVIDKDLFKELSRLTTKGFAMFRGAGFASGN